VTNYAKLLRTLVDGGVDFVLVGGVAATVHGSARFTQDVDVAYARTPTNLQRIVTALKPLKPYLRGAPPGLPFEWSVATLTTGLNFTLTTTAGPLDLLGEVTGGGSYADVLAHSEVTTIFEREIRVVDLPTLIRMKRASARIKDLESAAELEALAEEGQRRSDGQ
jgi:hypothetical protein